MDEMDDSLRREEGEGASWEQVKVKADVDGARVGGVGLGGSGCNLRRTASARVIEVDGSPKGD